ncbi:MAG TPA: LysE family transporter [Ktedonobacterales bacterium]
MMVVWRLAFLGVGLGLAYAAAPGAVNTEAMRRGSAHGSLSALLVETGSLLGDGLWAALALIGVSLTARFWPVQLTLALAGGFFLLRMAWSAGRDALFGRADSAPAGRRAILRPGWSLDWRIRWGWRSGRGSEALWRFLVWWGSPRCHSLVGLWPARRSGARASPC